jgi:hypothetical protein
VLMALAQLLQCVVWSFQFFAGEACRATVLGFKLGG